MVGPEPELRAGQLADPKHDGDLRVHLDRYQTLVLALAQVIWTCDPKGEMVGEQPSWRAYTGQSLDQYQGMGWLEAVHPDDRAENLKVWNRAVAVRGPCVYEHRLRRHDGTYRYFSVRAVPVFTDDGSIREWAGIHSDITQRKLTEQSLRDGERRFRELAHAMPTIVWTADPDGSIDFYNQRWVDYTGMSVAETQGWGWKPVLHPEDLERCIVHWTTAFTTGAIYEIKYRFKRAADGTYRWHLGRAIPIRDGDGKITKWFGTCVDIEDEISGQAGSVNDKTLCFSWFGDLLPSRGHHPR